MTRLAVAVLTAAAAAAAVVGVDLGRRVDDHTYIKVVTTTDTTPTTVWHEALPVLPDGFDPAALAPKSKPTARARTAPTAIIHAQPAAAGYDVAELEQIIRDGFARFGPAVAEEAVNVAWCETGQTLDPNSTGAEGEVGLLQIHPRFHTERAAKFGWTMADLYDPAKNVAVAVDIYAESQWQPWTCRYAA